MENISVSVRVRPLNKQEEQEIFAWRIDGNSIVQLDSSNRDVDRTKDTKYVLDHVFGPDWTTEKIYEVTTQELIHKMVNGFNSTVFAYGQTSSGKTHTMRGTHDSPGIIPLAVTEAFRLIEANESREYLIRVSYMEIYNEDINDLLAPENIKLPIKEGPYGPYVCGLREDIVISPEQVLELLTTGEANRHIGSTKMNEKSSRSHTIFRMVVESRAVDAESDDAGAVLVSALSLVDLAGSERVAKTGAEGIRMKEGTAINKSLLTLGNVINKLSEGALATGGHIPYRDSKLTRILQPSLGGNAKTAIICAMTPAWCHREESHITLRFACRAKSVVNNAIVNEVLSDAAVLKRQAKEIEELKRQLAAGNGGCKNADEQINGLRAQLLRSEQEKELIKAKLEEEKELIKAKLEEEQQEKEKARREAENTKKLFFQSREEPSDGVSRRNNRRETWCPGKSAWAMPNEQSLTETTTNSGGGESSQRKRAFGRVDGDGTAKGLSTLMEEDEEDGDVAEGPTPQRRRREYSAMSDYNQDEDAEQEEIDMHRTLEHIMSSLPAQERITLNLYLQQHQEVEERVEALERELMDRERLAAQQAENDRSALDVSAQQLEQAKWLARQFERKVEDLQALCRSAEEARDALSASNVELESAMEAKCKDFNNRFKELTEKYAAAKQQAQTLKAELIDTRAALEKREYEFGRLEAKEADTKAKLDEAEAKFKQKAEEVGGLKTMAQAAEERTLEAEKRARILYDEVQRLEVHVQELESRKRAPLYQKKQEEELKAAVEKAKECEVRALEAELRSKELRASVEVLKKELTELHETSAAAARQAAQAHEDLVERHALELQRLTAASALQQERHEEAVANLRALIDELEAKKTSLGEQVQAKDQQLSEMQLDAAALRGRIGELEAQEAELQACAVAAQEKIAHLEQAAEAQAAAHEAALAALEQQHKDALAQNEQAHKEALSSAIARHGADTAALEGKLADVKASNAHLDMELCAARERADLLVKASLEQSQSATIAQAELQRQVAELSAKVQEASGALKAKEELKEERLRNKQEIANLKSELQKLQLESKNGAKGKDLAQKELEALKKRLTDTETKLRTALQEKTAALLEKSNFERQLKQNQSQKLMIEKTLEKKDAIENKKRESMMVKSKEQLNSVEERLRIAQVELQKLQMDMTAKQCECSGLEEELNEQRMQNVRLQDANEELTNECTDLRLQLECLNIQHKEAIGQRNSAQEELEESSSRLKLESDLMQVRASLAIALENEQRYQASLAELRCQYETLLLAKEALHPAHGSIDETAQSAAEAGRQARDELAALSMRLVSLEEERQALCSQLAAAEEALDVARADLSAAASLNASVQGKLREEASAEATKLNAALFAASQQTGALKAELDSVRAQLREAQSIGCLANVTCDLTRSLSGPMPRLLPVDELQRQLNELTAANQELEEMVFAMTEREDAAQRVQTQLKSQLAATDLELARRCQQVVELQQQCAGLEEELAAVRTHVSVLSQPGPVEPSVASQAFQDQLTKLTAERDGLAARLTEVLASQEELRCGIAEHIQQREQLLHVIDDLSAQLANKQDCMQQQFVEHERVLQVTRQDAEEQDAMLQGQNLQLQAAVEEHVIRCQELSSQLDDLQHRYDVLQQKHGSMEQELAELRVCSGAASLETGPSADNIAAVPEDAHLEFKNLRMRVMELQQRQAELEAEMSDVQAACNVAIAEKHTLERTMTHRMLELETANIRFQDTIAKLQGERGPLPMEMDDSLLEREQLSCQVHHLTVSLENAIAAKEEACKRLEAELGVLRIALASAQESNTHLEEARRTLEEEVKCAGGKIDGLKEALSAATVAVADAERHASEQVNDAKNALSSLLLSYDQLVTQNSQLEIKLNDKSADVEALRAGLAEAVEKGKKAERQSEDLASTVSELRAELHAVQATLEETVASRDEVAKRMTEAEASINLCHQLEMQVLSLQAAVKRLTEEAAESKEAAASLDAEVQELLDANTLLESQVRELRAQLASRPTEIDHAEAITLAARLSESEALRYKLEQQVAEIAQQMSTASSQQRAGALERAELEHNLLSAKEACAGLEAKLGELTKAHKQLLEENQILNEQLKGVRAQLQASGGERVSERLHELQSQLEMQEDRHRVATDRLREELATVQKQTDEQQQEFSRMEASLRQHIQNLSHEFEKLQDSHEECQLLAEQREAELNAQKLALQSQIHWLTENKERLENPPPPLAVPVTDERLNALEEELRRTKRAEQKLQGLLYRIRKDFEDNKNGVNVQNLMDMRSLQYDVDMLTQKCKRLQREIQMRDDARAQLQAQLEAQERQLATLMRSSGSKAQNFPSSGPSVLVDKENLPYR
ncbi:hypothetical protein Vretimale_1382 [Volvox reticuliferus]|uniref:Kinesin motor domain-containing protein n=2 Tax=Volvox reticuliferus TaxID=1737510 RepID=A0A8J4G3C2_9CHLO|nr:hypothetical protein Vretimale_1382 [Volvox reticuliferus]